MIELSLGIALFAAVAIIVIGVLYIRNPRVAAQSFGLPLPDHTGNSDWWLRLKGVRDIASGVVVLAMMTWAERRLLGIVLLVEAAIPLGDMILVFAAKGSIRRAIGIHGLTAGLMVLAALVLILRLG